MDAKLALRLHDVLLKHKTRIASKYEAPGLQEADRDIASANLFFLGAVMDYGMHANDVWDNAEELLRVVGPAEVWHKINDMPEQQWLDLRRPNGGYFHRFWRANGERSIARKLRRVAGNIVEKFNGDVRNVWEGKTADEVYRTLVNDVEVNLTGSRAVVNFIVMLLVGQDLIRGTSDLKADLHVRMVLGRIMRAQPFSNAEDAVAVARVISPHNPSEIDLPLFHIGQQFCRRSGPRCMECPMRDVCSFHHTSRKGNSRRTLQ